MSQLFKSIKNIVEYYITQFLIRVNNKVSSDHSIQGKNNFSAYIWYSFPSRDPFPALHKNRAMNNLSSQMSQSELYLPLTSVHSRSKEKFPKCKVVYEFALVVDATMTFVGKINISNEYFRPVFWIFQRS